MFVINEQTQDITLHSGDTGVAAFHCDCDGHVWDENDRVVFTVTNANGETVLQNSYRLTDGDEAGDYEVVFANATTDTWPAGSYRYEVRYIINPVWVDGFPVDGDQVITPANMPRSITILPVLAVI